jgi:hypothetical protein
MQGQEPSQDAANDLASRPRPTTVDDFVTWSEIEQKIQQVAQPQARPHASPSNWRWGWVVIPIMLGASRLISSGTKHNDPPIYNPPNPHFDRKQIEFIMPAAKPPQDIPPGQFGGALEEMPKAKNAQEPVGPPKP